MLWIVCPACLGRPLLNAKGPIDWPCDHCGGTGKVGDKSCRCGRPAINEIKGKPVCSDWGCQKRAKDPNGSQRWTEHGYACC